jgi:hypothetical protein
MSRKEGHCNTRVLNLDGIAAITEDPLPHITAEDYPELS